VSRAAALLAVLAASLLPTAAAAATTEIAPGDQQLRYEGRWDVRPDRATTVNSGSRIFLRFTGDAIAARFDVAGITYPPQVYAYVDGVKSPPLIVDKPVVQLASGLPWATHTVILAVKDVDQRGDRWVSPFASALELTGLALSPGATLDAPPPAPTVRMTFLGDSITQGINVLCEGSGSTCADGTRDYAWLVAAAFGAGLEQVGFGSQGVTKGGGGNVPAAGPALDFDFQGSPSTPWPADVVVINQGTNDYGNSPLAVRDAYLDYLRRVRAHYPHALIVALEPFGIGGVASTASVPIQQAVSEFADPRTDFVSTRGWLLPPDFTEQIHPNVTGHEKAAKQLAQAISQLTGLPQDGGGIR
jgi:lysophospholipase L1-like esterase